MRAKRPLPLGTWTTVTVTYDGSSRAAGIAIYADGVPLDTDVVRDRLYKDITYSKARGDLLDRAPLAIGARFRDSGFKHGRIDDLRIFDVALTRAEVETLASAGPARRTPDAHAAHAGAVRDARLSAGAGAARGDQAAAHA